jgi:hypothetical protein
LNLPGEGWERAFRGWLAMDFLLNHLGWPTTHIVFGERFDILLLDQTLMPAVNVETKAPDWEASEKERSDFEARLRFYGTLRWAFFTNGRKWTRLRLQAPRGNQNVTEREDLLIEKAIDEAAASFFDVLTPDHFIA